MDSIVLYLIFAHFWGICPIGMEDFATFGSLRLAVQFLTLFTFSSLIFLPLSRSLLLLRLVVIIFYIYPLNTIFL